MPSSSDKKLIGVIRAEDIGVFSELNEKGQPCVRMELPKPVDVESMRQPDEADDNFEARLMGLGFVLVYPPD